ncbi:hypothetical protein HK096_009037, partial [Nowakowskiella sp. JEL0078]
MIEHSMDSIFNPDFSPMQSLGRPKFKENMSIDPSNGISPSAINDFGSGIHSELDQRFGAYGNFPVAYSGSTGVLASNIDFDQRDEFFNQKMDDGSELQTSSRSSRVSERRAEQNRAAQRAFRHRKNLYIKNLEAKVKHCESREAEFSVLDRQCKDLQTVLETLTRERDYINWERDAWKREREQILDSFEKMRWEISQLHGENASLRETLATQQCSNCGTQIKIHEIESPISNSIAITADIPPAEGCVIGDDSNIFDGSWCMEKTNSHHPGIDPSSTETLSLNDDDSPLNQLISEDKPLFKKKEIIIENCEVSKIKPKTDIIK